MSTINCACLSTPIKQLFIANEEKFSGIKRREDLGKGKSSKDEKENIIDKENNFEKAFVKPNEKLQNKFSINLEEMKNEKDQRKTLMIKNIPNKVTQEELLSMVNKNYKEKYDFFYLPIDFKNKCNIGYAFINLLTLKDAINFVEEFSFMKWTSHHSEKICAINYARVQGKLNLIKHFQKSSVISQLDPRIKPIIIN